MNFLRALGLLLLIVFAAPCARAHDWLRYLESTDWKLLPKPAGLPQHIRSMNCEWYLVADNNGRTFAMILPPESEVISLIAAHEFAEIIGVPQVPSWPVLVKRGVGPIPLLRDNGTLDAGTRYLLPPDALSTNRIDIAVPNGEWRSAILMPILDDTVYPDGELPVPMLLDALKLSVFTIVLSATNINSQHFGPHTYLTFTAGILHGKMRGLNATKFKKSMNPLSWTRLQNVTQEEAQWILEELGMFFDRLETVGTTHLRSIFDPHIRYESYHPTGRRFDGNVLSTMAHEIPKLRRYMEEYLHEKIRGPFLGAKLPREPLPPETLMVPRIADIYWNRADEVFKDRYRLRANARHYLEAIALTPNFLRPRLIEKWANVLGAEDPIQTLLDIALKWDGSVRLTNTKPASLRRQRPADAVLAQVALDFKMPKTLVVFGKSDREGEAIGEILSELKTTLPLIPLEIDLSRGRFLTRQDIDAIALTATRINAKRVLLIECGGLTEEDRQALSRDELKLIQLDHHEDQPRRQWHRYSSLEQFADFVGYDLDADQRITALLDRAGPMGLFQMGWTMGQLEKYLAPKIGNSKLNLLRAKLTGVLDSDADVIVYVPNFPDGIGPLKMALNLESAPGVPALVVERPRSVYITGGPKLVEGVLKSMDASRRFTVLGGDYSTSLYAVLLPRGSTASVQSLGREAVEALKNHPELRNPCVVEIAGASLQLAP